MNYIEIKTPAKINVGLYILSKRPDGFHNLNTLFYPINDLCDTLTFQHASQFEFICNDESIPHDESNLVYKTAKLIEQILNCKIDVRITLEKRIPTQAGLGGGSSDAAATLVCLNELYNLDLKYEQLLGLALQLGSDVPFFIKAKPAIGKSRGEILEYVDLNVFEPILIVNPRINISTGEAFQNITSNEIDFDFKSIISNSKLNYKVMKDRVINDFEQYAFLKHDEIKTIKGSMYDMGALFALMSGSGSTVYGIFPNRELAKTAMQKFSKSYFCWLSNPDR